MDLALLVVEGLRQIYKLQDAIRRQRRVNRTTYLRMMEIYVELEMSEPLQGNPTLVRTDAIKKFSDAVATFSWYLQKHNDMHRVVRIFKFATMEKQRQKIVDEINEIFQMLNLATSVAVMNGQAAASTNAARLMTKLEAMHGDIRLSHDEIHAALVEEKQQLQIPKMKMLREGGPTLEDVTADEVAKGEVLVRQAPLRKTDGPPPVDELPFVEWDILPNGAVDSSKISDVKQNSAAGTMEVTATVHDAPDQMVRGEKSVRAEKTTPLAATVELEQHSGEDSIIEKPILNGVKQDTVIDEPEEELEPREEYTADEVEQSASDKTTEEKDGANQTAPFQQSNTSVPLLIQRLSSDQATEQEQEQTLLDLLRNESFFAQLYALHCLSWFTFSYSKMRESEFEILQKCVREPTHLEILTLLHQLQYGDENVKEIAVLQSSCMATRADGDALLRVGVLTPVIGLLKDGTANHKLWAAEMLATLASDDDANGVAIARGGAIPPLVSLLRSGTDMQKQEAAYALGNLAANNKENRGKIAREGAIPPMVAFVKAVTDAQSQWAVYALGSLSVENEENRVLIAQEGAIPPLIALLRAGTRAQKQWAAYSLGNLAHNDANRVEITQNGAIAPLIELLRSGTAMLKQRAAFALGNLACDNDTVSDFDEAILPLVELVRTGSDTQQEDAAYTLGNLASNNDERRVEIGRIGAIPPLVKLLHTGTGSQKQGAAFALRCLACNNDSNRAAIVEEGAIAPLASLIDEGTEEQIEEAANALKHLVAKNDAIAQAFIPDSIMTPLMEYLRAGVDATSRNANVAAALSTFGTVREGVIPMLHKLVNPASVSQNRSVTPYPADPKAENKLRGTAAP
ncbi:Armadillo-type fold [Phytophthora cactorum]|nr:Armadillo-type fold [Phytophthora cactorum]